MWAQDAREVNDSVAGESRRGDPNASGMYLVGILWRNSIIYLPVRTMIWVSFEKIV